MCLFSKGTACVLLIRENKSLLTPSFDLFSKATGFYLKLHVWTNDCRCFCAQPARRVATRPESTMAAHLFQRSCFTKVFDFCHDKLIRHTQAANECQLASCHWNSNDPFGQSERSWTTATCIHVRCSQSDKLRHCSTYSVVISRWEYKLL